MLKERPDSSIIGGMRRVLLPLFALAVFAFPNVTHTQAPQGPSPQSDQALLDRAKALHKKVPLIDGHNDYPWALRENAAARPRQARHQQAAADDHDRHRAPQGRRRRRAVLVGLRPRRAQPACRSPPRSSRSTSSIAWCASTPTPSSWRSPPTTSSASSRRARSRRSSAWKAGTRSTTRSARCACSTALGARYMTLTHSKNIAVGRLGDRHARPQADSRRSAKQVVREMNRLGMLVDLSHVSPDTMEDAIRVVAGAGDLLALVGARRDRRPAQRARRRPAAAAEERRRRDGHVRAGVPVVEGRRLEPVADRRAGASEQAVPE